jgi:hypothetical protein
MNVEDDTQFGSRPTPSGYVALHPDTPRWFEQIKPVAADRIAA